jgi:hypothetical protein
MPHSRASQWLSRCPYRCVHVPSGLNRIILRVARQSSITAMRDVSVPSLILSLWRTGGGSETVRVRGQHRPRPCCNGFSSPLRGRLLPQPWGEFLPGIFGACPFVAQLEEALHGFLIKRLLRPNLIIFGDVRQTEFNSVPLRHDVGAVAGASRRGRRSYRLQEAGTARLALRLRAVCPAQPPTSPPPHNYTHDCRLCPIPGARRRRRTGGRWPPAPPRTWIQIRGRIHRRHPGRGGRTG